MPTKLTLHPIFVLLLALSALELSACAQSPSLSMAPMADMPGMVQSAPETTQQAYQFAAANPVVLKQIACYCGCVKIGHKSNYDCYISGVDSAGKLTFNDHATGCKVCIDITQAVMTRLRQGEDVPRIQAYIERAYSQYGPAAGPEIVSGGQG